MILKDILNKMIGNQYVVVCDDVMKPFIQGHAASVLKYIDRQSLKDNVRLIYADTDMIILSLERIIK